ncbi:hypothetical protein [Haloechinothrix halophila]|uniref:hypothetical protein n=1 Tax=Haloechinothrix halophila TaxID=1069073 RepID=UPI00042A19B2|nr:hypothetical protein [Haloechinothrix halophila]
MGSVREAPPAGGAALDEVIIAAILAFAVIVPLMIFVMRERAGKRTLLGRLADTVSRYDGLPRWAGLPIYLLILADITGGIGVYWDVPIHMELGRDEGPLANPSHYPIYFALLGIFSAGVISATLARKELPLRTFRIGPAWRAPMGSIVVMVCGIVGVAGFPLDDIWHRLFGQDVTEWGPTHVLMIGGAVLTPIGIMLLLAEAKQVGARAMTGRGEKLWGVLVGGMWVTTITAFLMEFEHGIPQFPLLNQVVLVAIATTWGLIYARVTFGPGGALAAIGLYVALRCLLYVVVVPFDLTPAPFLPYIGEAILIELVALVISPKRGYLFGAVSGVAVGTIGVLSEWPATHWFMPQAWPAEMIGKFMVFGTIAGVSAGLAAVWQLQRLDEIGRRTASDPRLGSRTRMRTTHALGLAGAVGMVGVMAVVVPPQDPPPITGDLVVTEASASRTIANDTNEGVPPRWVDLAVTLHPSDADTDLNWLSVISWQGGDFFRTEMVKGADGVYRSERSVPVYGSWKTGVRLHTGNNLMAALPVYLPYDSEIAAPPVAAESGTRTFGPEHELLQRERKPGVPEWLWTLGFVVVGVVWFSAWILWAWMYTVAAAGPVPATRRRTQPKATAGVR